MEPKKRKLHRSFNPEKYKMAYCPYCKGTGKSSNEDEGVKVCAQCGGFGWVKKGEDNK
jgi:DnaJ-class molecular chaperone